MQSHIVYDSDAAQDLTNLLAADDLEVVLSSTHRPRCIIEFISQSLHLLDIDITKRQVLVNCFSSNLSVCELLASRFRVIVF